jgi:uncharacterized protein (TIGR02679 family)
VVVAAAAERLGRHSAPLVCLEGVPSTAALELLGAMRRAGVAVAFHADFDWTGVRIGNLVAAHVGAVPWRFAAKDYERALAATSDRIALKGASVSASWDGDLEHAMRNAGSALFEEQVLESLLEDLSVRDSTGEVASA